MEAIRLGEIAEVVRAELRGDPDSVPTGASVDSRTLRKGEIFFALRGERTDGHMFVGDALRKGASAAVVGRRWMEENPDVGPLLGVDDPLKALGKLGAWYRRRLGVEVVAVTGSNGKTTVKEMTAAVLGASYNVL
ncbi:MAG TPA: UDP-N-acetylmuramoyl-tripeptide--D-alanyl-D-alanine ligase, partial [Candidatus Latescibacteria bacterium]|nr:UDP-N-acetylmuramoyl-tripeptide--D-alanyl-D-alanine ligase [Candidatus Latescibacterota bacterium]